MRRQYKRVLGVLLMVGLLIVTSLVGCKPQPAEQPQPTAAPQEAAEKEVATAEPTQAPAPAAKEKVTLKVVMTNNVESFLPGEDENNNEIIRYLEEKSGFDLEWTILPADEPWQKLALMMTSGDPPDVIYCPPKSVFADYLHQDALADITDYVAQSPNLQKLVPPETWAAVTWEGRIYAVPIPQNQNIAGTSGVFVRKDWFRELGLEEPTTLDEYYEVMKAFKEKKGVIPLTVTSSSGLIGGFTGAFGLGTAYKEKDGKLVYSYVEPEAKEYLAYMKKLYEEGLLDKEFPVNKSANVQEKMVAGQAAMSVVGWSAALPIDSSFKEKNPDGELGYIAPPVGPRGESGFNRHAPVRVYLLIPAQSKHIKEAVEFLDFMSREDIYTYVSFGEEGKHFERRDGEVFLLDEYQNRRFQMYYTLVDTQEGFAVRLRDKGFKVYSDQVVNYSVLEPLDTFAPPIPEVMSVEADLGALVEEYFVRFITGDLPLEQFDEYVEQWKAKGGELALEKLNNWYLNEFKK